MNSEKNILVLTHAGGSSKYGPNMRWYNLGSALKKFNIKTTIIASSYFHKYIIQPQVKNLLSTEFINGLEYIWVKTNIYKRRGFIQVLNQFEFVLKSFFVIKKVLKRKPKLVIASSPHPFIVFPAFIFSKIVSAKLVFESRDLWPQVLLELGVLNKFNPYYWLLNFSEYFGVVFSDFVFSVKKGEYDYYKKKYNLRKSKFIYLANSFFSEKLNKKNISIDIKEYSKKITKSKKFVLSYVGALSTYYNIESILLLAKKAKKEKLNVIFLIVGDGDLYKKLNYKINLLKLQNIHLLGKLKRSDAKQILKISNAGYVSLQDLKIHEYGISCNKIYEYMYFSLPILGHYYAKYDPVKEAKCGLVSNPSDIKQLFKNLKFMINNPSLLKDMSKNSYKYFKENHDSDKLVKSLVDLI